MFTVIDAAMLRVTTRASDADGHDWPDLSGGTVQQWRDWLSRTWADKTFAHAVAAASPDLARTATAVCAGLEKRPRRVRSAVVSVLRYQLRASSRPTPFGLFAGIAPTGFGPATAVRVGDDHRATTRVEAAWLSGVVTELDLCPGLAERLPVTVNNAATVRDGRLVIGLRQDPVAVGARTDPAEVSIRYTAAVELVVRMARTPIRLGDLADRLAAAFPGTATPVITAMLRHLVEQRVLISSLRPPMTVTDPLAHVLTALADARAEEVPAAAGLLTRLRECRTANRPGPVDLRVDADVVLPRAVAGEIARAAEVLARLTPHPFGKPTWLNYHARFLERYGIGAAVPLMELVNPDIGLGFPAGYRGSLQERPTSRLADRDSALMRLAQTAAMKRSVEVVLDDSGITELEADNLERAQFPPHTELAVRIHAPGRTALDSGDFSLVVAGAFRSAGTTAGRFLDLLHPAERDRVAKAYAGLPTVNDGAMRVQVSCPPLYTETESVARSPQLLPELLSISEHRPDAVPGDGTVLVPEDLLVVGDAHRFYLWSRSKARPVEPELFSAVEFTNFAHPLLRFVCELTTARAAACRTFSWGMAAGLPFLPRLTYRRTILSPARWALSAVDLPGKDVPWPEWTAEVANWREQMMVPAAIYLGSDDQRIRLDLDEPAHLHLLRAQLDRYGQATVHEAPAADASGWLDGHAHEIVVPLASTQARTWPPIPARTAPMTATTNTDGHLPGSGEWLYCKLYGHPNRHTTLLTTHLPELLRTLDGAVQWWFLPYRDPDDHLRLRIRLTDHHDFGHVATKLGAWADELRGLGLTASMQLDTYRPETGRFGHGQAIAAAEAAFAADSAAASMQRAHLAGSDTVDVKALTAASLLDLASAFTGSQEAGAAWVIEHVTADAVPTPDRAVYDQALHLADPSHDAVCQLPGGEQIVAAWDRRRTELLAYRHTLTSSDAPAPDSVLGSLLHLHCLRTFGIDPNLERICHRLARAASLSQTAHAKARS